MTLAESSQCLEQAQVQNCWRILPRNPVRPAQLLPPVLQSLHMREVLHQSSLNLQNGANMSMPGVLMMF